MSGQHRRLEGQIGSWEHVDECVCVYRGEFKVGMSAILTQHSPDLDKTETRRTQAGRYL